MKIRHVIDESGLALAGLSTCEIEETIDAFFERLLAARDRNEVVMRTGVDIWDAAIVEGVCLHEFLYGDGGALNIDIDRRRRLQIAIDRIPAWDEQQDLLGLVMTFDVQVDGVGCFAPSLALAHAFRTQPRAIGCLNFRSSGRADRMVVRVGEEEHALHFVIDESTHLRVFRDAVDIEDMDEAAFAANSTSAFPQLAWADEVWKGLGSFRRGYREHRSTMVRHLSALNDVGAQLFHDLSASHPEQIPGHLGGHGVDASDENGHTKTNAKCRKDRTRTFRGQEQVFWWHTKLHPKHDRIHFTWLRNDEQPPGEIVIGIFTEHCKLPGDD